MFSCEYCETFKNTYFEEHLRMAATITRTRKICWEKTIDLNNVFVILFPLLESTEMYSRRTIRSETIFGNWKPFKNDEKSFLFHLKSSFRSQDI